MPRLTFREWPPYSPTDQNRRDNAVIAARLMVNAAFTAPTVGGIAMVEGEIVYGEEEQEQIARQMEALAHQREGWKQQFLYEAVMARECDAIVLLGNTNAYERPWKGECGLCAGRPDCSFVFENRTQSDGIVDASDRRSDTIVRGPLCVMYAHQLGYNVGSALMAAVHLFVDARPLISIGLAAQKLDYCRNSAVVIGIGVTARTKAELEDPGVDYHLINMSSAVESIRANVNRLSIRPATGKNYLAGDLAKKA